MNYMENRRFTGVTLALASSFKILLWQIISTRNNVLTKTCISLHRKEDGAGLQMKFWCVLEPRRSIAQIQS